MTALVPVEDLLTRILDTVAPLDFSPQPLRDARGLPVCEDVASAVALPPFDNSSMDGYAVRTDDLADAAESSPVVLPVVGGIGAGQAEEGGVAPVVASGTAVKVMTGAPLPEGADAVVPYEWTDRGADTVSITRAPEPGQHVRRRGSDVTEGQALLSHGTVLGPRQLGLLAAVGRSRVAVRPRPRVVVLSTGSELREPGTALGADQIYDANSYLLAAAAQEAGAIAYRVGAVPDDPAGFAEALSDQLVRADLVVTSGGVSEGDFDVVKAALGSLGTMWFGGVAMQPGKPQGFGVVGEDKVPVFTLPGNPVSSYISFQVFVLPAIRRMMGALPYSRPRLRATLTEAVTSPPGKRQFLRGRYDPTARVAATSLPEVTPVGGPGSHLLASLAEANTLIVLPEEVTEVAAGSPVWMMPLDVPLDVSW